MLMLTTFDLDEYVYDALRAGASGFLLKDVPPEQLVAGDPRRRRRRRAARAVGHPPADRGVLAGAAGRGARLPRWRPHRARARGAAPDRPGPVQRRDRRRARSSASPRSKTHVARMLVEARPARPRAGGRARLRVGRGQHRRNAPLDPPVSVVLKDDGRAARSSSRQRRIVPRGDDRTSSAHSVHPSITGPPGPSGKERTWVRSAGSWSLLRARCSGHRLRRGLRSSHSKFATTSAITKPHFVPTPMRSAHAECHPEHRVRKTPEVTLAGTGEGAAYPRLDPQRGAADRPDPGPGNFRAATRRW